MSANFASVLVALVAVVGCSGESTSKRNRSGEAEAGGDAGSGAGGSTSTGGASATGGSAGMVIGGTGGFCGPSGAEPWLELDASDCEERAEGDCTGFGCGYISHYSFQDVPALSACEEFVSADGCGRLSFDFDANGCATVIGPPPEAWDVDEHLRNLRQCMTEVFASGRFACLASSSVSFHESCFIY